jgi:hypothetical protein
MGSHCESSYEWGMEGNGGKFPLFIRTHYHSLGVTAVFAVDERGNVHPCIKFLMWQCQEVCTYAKTVLTSKPPVIEYRTSPEDTPARPIHRHAIGCRARGCLPPRHPIRCNNIYLPR